MGKKWGIQQCYNQLQQVMGKKCAAKISLYGSNLLLEGGRSLFEPEGSLLSTNQQDYRMDKDIGQEKIANKISR